MFGYVLPSRDRLDERERERFRAVYCGLCHTLRERYGFAASLLLNYDFTLLAILLSSGDEESCTVRRCAVHPCQGLPRTDKHAGARGCGGPDRDPLLVAAAGSHRRPRLLERAQIPLCFALSARCLPQGRGAAAALRRGGAAASPSARGAGRMRAAPPLIWRQSPSRR